MKNKRNFLESGISDRYKSTSLVKSPNDQFFNIKKESGTVFPEDKLFPTEAVTNVFFFLIKFHTYFLFFLLLRISTFFSFTLGYSISIIFLSQRKRKKGEGVRNGDEGFRL